MSTSTKLGDDFLRVPKLAADGENWVTYKDRLQWSVDARGLLGHLDGTETKPVDPSTLTGRGASWVPASADEMKEVVVYKATMKEWRMGEAIVKQQIAGTIPDTLSNMFEQRSRIVSVELLRKLQEQKCGEKANVREHFDKMRTIREQLSSLGQAPTDESFAAIILGSLPASRTS